MLKLKLSHRNTIGRDISFAHQWYIASLPIIPYHVTLTQPMFIRIITGQREVEVDGQREVDGEAS